MDFPSTKSVHEQSDSTGPQESSPAAPSAAAATFERQLSEIANSDGGGGAMPAASALQSAQSTWVLIGRQGKHLLYSEDARLISGLEKALIGNPTHRNAGDYLTSLRSFGGWLFANNKTSIVARLNDPSLTHDAREFEKRRPSNILAALNHLRTFQSTGGVTVTARTELNPHPQDADLINEYKKETATSTGRMYATALRSFGHYLRENNKKGIATRLSGGALDEDVNSYKKGAGADSRIGAALAQLRKSQAGAKAMEPERHFDPKDAALMESMQVGDAAAQHSASQQAGSWSEELNHLRTFQSTGGVTVTARTELNPHPQDADLINEYKKETATSTGRMYATALRSFGHYLRENNKKGIATRLSGGALDEDVNSYKKGAGADSRIGAALAQLRKSQAGAKAMEPERHFDPKDAALMESMQVGDAAAQHSASQQAGSWSEELNHLRTFQSTGGVTVTARTELNPHPQDADLINEYKKETATSTGRMYATALRSFGHYLRENNKKGIATRLSGGALDEDINSYKKGAGADSRIGAALAQLRKSQAGANAMELERHIDPKDAALMESMQVGDAAAQHSASQQAGSWPEEFLPAEGHDQDLGRMDEPGPSSSAPQPAQSTGILRGRRKPLYSEDAPLISGLEEALRSGNAAERTAKDLVGPLRAFGRWLLANNKTSIVDRLEKESLTDDAREFIEKGKGSRLLIRSIGLLRTFQSTGGVTVTATTELNPYLQDAALIIEYQNEAATSTGGVYATALRSFGHHLRENNKKGIATRLSGGALDEDVEAYKKDFGGIRTIDAALGQLRKSQAGAKAMERERYISPGPDPEGAALMEPRRAGDAAAQHSSQEVGSWPEKLLPAERHEQDLVLGLMDEPGPSSSLEPVARHDQASDPGDSIRPLNWRRDGQQFSEEPMAALARSNLPPSEEILINDEQDAAELRPAKRPRTLDNPQGLAIERLLSEIAATPAPTHQQGASPWHAQPMMQASGHEDATAPHAAATYVAGAAAQHSAPQGAVSRPLVLPEGYDRDLRLMGKDGPSWPEVPPGQAQDIVQAGRQQPAWSASTWSPQMPLDFDWSMWPTLEAAPAPAARARSGTYGGLESLVHLDAPTPSELRDDAHFAAAPFARARSDAYRGFPLVDLTAPTPSESRDDANSVRPFPSTSANAQIGALDPTVSSHGHGLVLDDTEWLGDQHIDRDYGLQEQDLQRNDPDLAARTRFVNPLIALNYLRSNDDGVVLTEFQRIVYDDNGNDTADFLFLPVINGNPEDPNSRGNHWSLLFVDRSDRWRPVAYHYDSYGGLNNRDAAHLARRLNLPLELADMAQQQNTYDCGVFVVDGTRELVRQLAQGWEPDQLNLSNVVANRQALQNRLRG